MTDCEQQLAVARRQLEAVQRISAALFSVTDLDALQRLALRTAMDVVEADAGSLLVYDEEKHALVFRYVVGPVADTLTGTALDLSLGSGIAGQVFHTGRARITRNVDEDADHVGTVDAQTGYRTHSLMTVPLRRREAGRAFGVVQLVNKRAGDFDESDVAVIEIMGSLVIMAVQNATLAQRARLATVAYSVGEISHDIGNMLTYILPYVETLNGYIADVKEGKPGAMEALEAFYKEVVKSVAEGVEQVEFRAKEIARAVKGEVAPLVFKEGHPMHVAGQVARAFAAVAERHQITLTLDGDPEMAAVFDQSRLYNALYNLISNAIPETPAGGKIAVTIGPCPDAPDFYQVAVSDTGRGMPEEVRAALFTDAATTTKAGGTGLGTRIVGRIVEQHGGTASVESAPGVGTTITLRLPRAPAAQTGTMAP